MQKEEDVKKWRRLEGELHVANDKSKKIKKKNLWEIRSSRNPRRPRGLRKKMDLKNARMEDEWYPSKSEGEMNII